MRAYSCKICVIEMNKRMPFFRENFPRLRRKGGHADTEYVGLWVSKPVPDCGVVCVLPLPRAHLWLCVPVDKHFDCEFIVSVEWVDLSGVVLVIPHFSCKLPVCERPATVGENDGQ